MTRELKIKTKLRSNKYIWLTGITLLLMLSNCTQKDNNHYYGLYYDNNTEPQGYMIKKINIEDSLRREWTFVYSANFQIKDSFIEILRVNIYEAYKVYFQNDTAISKPYFTTLSKNCINYNLQDNDFNDIMSTQYCFIDKRKSLIVDGKKYIDVYEFIKTTGKGAGVKAKIFMDNNFILLKEEYLSGYTDKYRIERLESPPTKLKNSKYN